MSDGYLAEHQMLALYHALDQVRRMPMSRPATHKQLLAAALVYAACGVPVFPCTARGKEPVTLRGHRDALAREDATRDRWRQAYGPRNIGMPTGPGTADVLDVDQRQAGNGWDALRQLRDAGLVTGAMAVIRTRTCGAHLFFAGTRQRCSRLKAHWLDFKADGGYVILPPSFVAGEDGVSRDYEVTGLRPPTGATINWQTCKDLLCPPRPARVRAGSYRRGPGSTRHLVEWLEGEYEGNRNNGLFWSCCRALEADDLEVLEDLADVAMSAGLPEAEVRRTIQSAIKECSAGEQH